MSPVKSLSKSMSASGPLSTTTPPLSETSDPGAKALAELEIAVNVNARKFNDLKQAADKKFEQLKQLQVSV